MRPLKTLLSAWQPGSSDTSDPLTRIRAQWATIVGEDIAANSRPSEFARGTLLVVTRSSAWSQQLSFLSEQIATAIAEGSGETVQHIRFRVGRISQRALRAVPSRAPLQVRRAKPETAVSTLEAAVANFKEDVQSVQRVKTAQGWSECNRCGVKIVSKTERLCAPCANARSAERAATIARLLFEVPFLGYSGIAEHVDALSRDEYETVRIKLLARWWDLLTQLRHSGRTRVTKHERDVASSYVLLKTGLDPERIAQPVVRDLLGDDLYKVFYENSEE